RLDRDRIERGARDLLDFVQHRMKAASDIGARAAVAGLGALRADVLEQLDDVEQGRALDVAREAVAAADSARRFDEAGAPEIAQHLREMVVGDPVFFGDLAGRELAFRIERQLQDRIERELRGLLEFHGAYTRSFSSWMKGPAIMPWLRKKRRLRRSSRASMVRSLRTPAL